MYVTLCLKTPPSPCTQHARSHVTINVGSWELSSGGGEKSVQRRTWDRGEGKCALSKSPTCIFDFFAVGKRVHMQASPFVGSPFHPSNADAAQETGPSLAREGGIRRQM